MNSNAPGTPTRPDPGDIAALTAGGTVDREALMAATTSLGTRAIEPLLDALAGSGSREVRLCLLDCLEMLGEEARNRALARAVDPRWYVTRNMLTLAARGSLPPGFDVLPFLDAEDPRVRVEAVGVARRLPDPSAALAIALGDLDPRVVTAALRVVEDTPADWIPLLHRIARTAEIEEMRVLAARALGSCPDPAVVPVLISLSGASRRLLGGVKIRRGTPEGLEALRGLARFSGEPEADAVLEAAARSADEGVRSAVRGE